MARPAAAVVTRRNATKDALLAFLSVDTESVARVRIYRYMFGIGVSVPATREQLRRLVKAGVVEREGNFYRLARGPIALETISAPD
jgi:hypothetical protein